jgi:hypothetical protein
MKVNIQPTVNMLQILRHVEYKPWYALAEYVDNSVQSFSDNRQSLRGPLKVNIEFDTPGKRIVIRDNAAGIAGTDLERALRAADMPPDRSGLNEFGMGMKSASCWFSPDWTIRTTCLGEAIERSVRFDLDAIAATEDVELDVVESPAEEGDHYTIIELNEVKDVPQGRTTGKIREHLRDIYRIHLRENDLELVVNGEELAYEDPKFLEARPYKNKEPIPDTDPMLWAKPVTFQLKDGRVVEGRAGLLAKGDTKRAGLILFRRKRAIQGTGEDPYRPGDIFGAGNSFESQRLWGEINLEDFEVSHTKDGIKWEGAEADFIEKLRVELDDEPVSLILQAKAYRAKNVTRENEGAEDVIKGTLDGLVVSAQGAGDDLDGVGFDRDAIDQKESLADAGDLKVASRNFEITLPDSGEKWDVTVELSNKDKKDAWMEYASSYDASIGKRQVQIRLLLNSPFMRKIVVRESQASLEPIVRMAAGLGLAEYLVLQKNQKEDTSAMRRTLGHLLCGSLSHTPEGEEENE